MLIKQWDIQERQASRPVDRQEASRIADRLYEQRGWIRGHELADWLKAESSLTHSPQVRRGFRLGQLLRIGWRILGLGFVLFLGVAVDGVTHNRNGSLKAPKASLSEQIALTAGYRAILF